MTTPATPSTTEGKPTEAPERNSATHLTGPQPRGLNPLQRDYLLRPLNANRVRQVQGMNHLEAWDVRRWLNRVFGIGGWSIETLALDLVREHQTKTNQGREAWAVLYRAQVRLTIRDPHGHTLGTFDDAAAGDAILPSPGDAHDFAMKTALSQALKRVAVNLGDQFGLSLYNGGGETMVDEHNFRLIKPVVQATMDTHGAAQAVRDEPVRGEQEAA